MNDTSPTVQKQYHDLLMQKTNEERLLMGLSMFESAREMVMASFQNDSSNLEKKIHLLHRFYGNDFSEQEMKKIEKHLARINNA
jgi:hypothetical protein